MSDKQVFQKLANLCTDLEKYNANACESDEYYQLLDSGFAMLLELLTLVAWSDPKYDSEALRSALDFAAYYTQQEAG